MPKNNGDDDSRQIASRLASDGLDYGEGGLDISVAGASTRARNAALELTEFITPKVIKYLHDKADVIVREENQNLQ